MTEKIDHLVISDRMDIILRNMKPLRAILTRELILDPVVEKLVVERIMQTIIQAMLDIGTHILARKELGRPNSYSEVFDQLNKTGIISENLYHKLEGLAGLRNLLVHEYFSVDYDRLKKHAVELELDSLAYVNEIKQYIGSKFQ